MSPIRIFIGSSSNGEDRNAEAVYEYSLRKNTDSELDIVWMRQTADANSFWHGFETSTWSTPFSGFRWAIPEYCNFSGRAIYTDVDMINFRDIKDLWEIDMKGKPFAARRGERFGGHEFCVMVIDCAVAKNWVTAPVSRQKTIEMFHKRMIAAFSGQAHAIVDLDPRWNCLDGENREVSDIWQLHWTKMATQPWKPSWFTGVPEEHPRKDLVAIYEDLLDKALKAGYGNSTYENLQYNIIGR